MDIFFKEVVVKNMAEMNEQVGIDGGIGIHLIQMVGRTWDLSGKPNSGPALLFQHGLNPVSDMYIPDL